MTSEVHPPIIDDAIWKVAYAANTAFDEWTAATRTADDAAARFSALTNAPLVLPPEQDALRSVPTVLPFGSFYDFAERLGRPKVAREILGVLARSPHVQNVTVRGFDEYESPAEPVPVATLVWVGDPARIITRQNVGIDPGALHGAVSKWLHEGSSIEDIAEARLDFLAAYLNEALRGTGLPQLPRTGQTYRRPPTSGLPRRERLLDATVGENQRRWLVTTRSLGRFALDHGAKPHGTGHLTLLLQQVMRLYDSEDVARAEAQWQPADTTPIYAGQLAEAGTREEYAGQGITPRQFIDAITAANKRAVRLRNYGGPAREIVTQYVARLRNLLRSTPAHRIHRRPDDV